MAFNPSPQVSVARDFSKKFNKKMVIIFHFDEEGQFGYASYGRNKTECNDAKIIANRIFDFMLGED